MHAKLWLVENPNSTAYDEYDSFVGIADTEERVLQMHPGEEDGRTWTRWPSPHRLKATELGVALDPTPRVVCASFNAG